MSVFLLSVLAGAVHVIAPDHWMPTSVLAWQRGWRLGRVILFTFLVLALHVALGAAVYFCLGDFFEKLESSVLVAFSFVLVFGVMMVRMMRFSRLGEVMRAGPHSTWGFFSVVSLLGPCESLIPVLIKSHHLGTGYLLPLVAFLLGTVLTGVVAVQLGRLLWDNPFWLPRGLYWARSRAALVPAVSVLLIGMGAVLRLGG